MTIQVQEKRVAKTKLGQGLYGLNSKSFKNRAKSMIDEKAAVSGEFTNRSKQPERAALLSR